MLVSNLILGSDWILELTLFWKRDSQFNSILGILMKRSPCREVYHQHPMLHIVNPIVSVYSWYPLSIIHVKLVEPNGILT